MPEPDVTLRVDLKSSDSLGRALGRLIDATRDLASYQAMRGERGYLCSGFVDEEGDSLDVPEIWAEDAEAVDGDPPLVSSETVFYRSAVIFPELRGDVLKLVQQILSLNKNPEKDWYRCLWANEEVPAGTDAIQELVMADPSFLPNYVDFLRTNDMDHEVYQSWYIRYLVHRLGASPGMAELLVARALGCCGQFGAEDVEEMAPAFRRFVEEGSNRELLCALIAKEIPGVEAVLGYDLISDFVAGLAEALAPGDERLAEQLRSVVPASPE
jgi:hypothetical protein